MQDFIKRKKIEIPELTSHVQTAKFILDVISDQNENTGELFKIMADDVLKTQLDIKCAISILCEKLDIDPDELFKDALALSDEKWPEFLKKLEDKSNASKLINSIFKPKNG